MFTVKLLPSAGTIMFTYVASPGPSTKIAFAGSRDHAAISSALPNTYVSPVLIVILKLSALPSVVVSIVVVI